MRRTVVLFVGMLLAVASLVGCNPPAGCVTGSTDVSPQPVSRSGSFRIFTTIHNGCSSNITIHTSTTIYPVTTQCGNNFHIGPFPSNGSKTILRGQTYRRTDGPYPASIFPCAGTYRLVTTVKNASNVTVLTVSTQFRAV